MHLLGYFLKEFDTENIFKIIEYYTPFIQAGARLDLLDINENSPLDYLWNKGKTEEAGDKAVNEIKKLAEQYQEARRDDLDTPHEPLFKTAAKRTHAAIISGASDQRFLHLHRL